MDVGSLVEIYITLWGGALSTLGLVGVAKWIVELLVREGRGSGQNCIFVTQRIADFPKILWANCYLTYMFKVLIPNDILYIGQMIPNFAELNRQLQRYEVLEYDHVTNEHRIIRPHEVIRRTRHYG